MAVEVAAPDEYATVFIVGGGYAGLASALFLAHQGVRPVLVDRHPHVSVQGRARGINYRTMEIYRSLGLHERVSEAGRPFDEEAGVVRCERMAGEWQWLLGEEARRALPDLTAGEFGMADQRSVEPILIDAARARGADIRLGTQCVAVHQDGGGVTAVTEDRRTGQRRTVRSKYLIAADGYGGTVREQVGIARTGPGVTRHWVTFVAEADLSGIVTERAMFWIVVNPDVGFGSFLSTAVPGQWAISVSFEPENRPASGFTAGHCAKLARAVIGRDLPVRIVDIAEWSEAVAVAERFRDGDVFLVGDSAHVWPASGAMGANTAVQDAHNLAWKLAAVLKGYAADSLLDSYQQERLPLATALADITTRRQAARFGGDPGADDVDDVLCILGQRYRSAAVVGALHDTVFGDRVEQDARPGTRAPHLWLERDGAKVAVHDLFHDAFILFTGAGGHAWLDAARTVAAQTGVPLRAYRVGQLAGTELEDVEGQWPARYRADPDGAVLVRPDGYVAWRCPRPSGDPASSLCTAIGTILGTVGAR